jgi:hypothetical protein
MLKTLFKVAVVAGAVAGAVHLWRKFEVTERLVAITDKLLTEYVVGEDEDTSRPNHEEVFSTLLRDRESAGTNYGTDR